MGKISNVNCIQKPPFLEISIIPAIPITYLGLIFGGTLNDLGVPIKMEDRTPINWDDAMKLQGNNQRTDITKYIQEQKENIKELKEQYQ